METGSKMVSGLERCVPTDSCVGLPCVLLASKKSNVVVAKQNFMIAFLLLAEDFLLLLRIRGFYEPWPALETNTSMS